MVDAAGGEDVMGVRGEPSFATTWDEVIAREPDIVVIAPCGFLAAEAAERAAALRLPCRAVAVDADSYFSRPAPRLADGVTQLGHILHPDAVPDPGLAAIEL
jgi:iron complex transport system substrate-binding protein